jgi:UDP-3-O-[3-hydroxymyristoyl] N-acetylglucosamine deacetylase
MGTSSAISPETTSLTVSGIGLITGKPVDTTIYRAEPGHGVVFYRDDAASPPIPARLESVVNTDRGVTLANRAGQTLSIVEHFLGAAMLAGLTDLRVVVRGAPELPILDGSARDWLTRFREAFPDAFPAGTENGSNLPERFPGRTPDRAVFYRGEGDIAVYAIPDTHFKVTYAVDFNHPDLKNRWVRWDSRADDPALVASAGTFGYVSELPALQARGLALGAGPENSLGLFEEGGYSRPLRHDDEPIYHKILDLIGDLSLSGVNPLTVNAHVFAVNAGHGSHTAFARRLLGSLR